MRGRRPLASKRRDPHHDPKPRSDTHKRLGTRHRLAKTASWQGRGPCQTAKNHKHRNNTTKNTTQRKYFRARPAPVPRPSRVATRNPSRPLTNATRAPTRNPSLRGRLRLLRSFLAPLRQNGRYAQRAATRVTCASANRVRSLELPPKRLASRSKKSNERNKSPQGFLRYGLRPPLWLASLAVRNGRLSPQNFFRFPRILLFAVPRVHTAGHSWLAAMCDPHPCGQGGAGSPGRPCPPCRVSPPASDPTGISARGQTRVLTDALAGRLN